MTGDRSIFSGMMILVDGKWVEKQAVIVEGQQIKAIIPMEMIEHHLPAKHYEFSVQHYLIPGLIDLHIHGADGHDVMDGTTHALKRMSAALAAEGVTGFLATTMTAENTRIEAALQAVAETQPDPDGAAILGVHLEGPFIAAAKLGAQYGEAAQLPDVELVRHWQKIANGAIRLITLAPELEGAIRAIELLDKMDLVVSIGHTDATYEQTRAAIAAGCSHATHLFNAMRGLHQREPGATGALLLSHDVMAELIVDGVHVHPAMVDLAWRLKGRDKLVLVSDAMRAKCLGNGRYELGNQMVDVADDRVTLPDGTLAGSVLRLPQAIKHMVQFTHCSLTDAIALAAMNPARVLKLESRKGSITVGKDADVAVLDANFNVALTMREGRVVYKH